MEVVKSGRFPEIGIHRSICCRFAATYEAVRRACFIEHIMYESTQVDA
jgi:hypothetical protein